MAVRQSLKLSRNTMSAEKIYEGVFAAHKPKGVTSYDVIRKLQRHFNPSELFRPWLEYERIRRDRESLSERKKRRMKRLDLKIGHGGTLDPLATGVLVLGVGKGTKFLNNFLACTKTYEAIVLFGAETDTYDRMGKIVRRGPYEHITREAVEKALEQFRGKIMQRPPIFSALRVQGKKLYEYAFEGKEPPIEIKSRPVEVSDLRILEWYEPGTHEFKWPEEEAAGEEKAVAEKLLAKDDALPVTGAAEAETEKADASGSSSKRKSPPPADSPKDDEQTSEAAPAEKKQKVSAEGNAAPAPSEQTAAPEAAEKATTETSAQQPPSQSQSQPPAVKIIMTVSSGFYVRSLAHDLGKALGSCALMSELVRSRQAEFELDSDKVLEYQDLDAGEEVWGPKVKKFLEEWEAKRAVETSN